MTGPRRYQIKARVSLVTLEKFRVWSEQQKRSMSRAAEDLIESIVKDVQLPEFPVRMARAPEPALVHDDEPLVPLDEFYNLLYEDWIPDAIVKTRVKCGLPLWIPGPLKLTDVFLAGYRARCVAAGRDADKDLEWIK